MKRLLYLSLLAVVSILASCSGQSQKDPDYLPFKESESDDWGLVSTDGKILFSDEFANEPTCAYRGRFFVKNHEDKWEMYTAEAKPRKVGDDEYDMVSVFVEDVIPVRKAGKKDIEFIDVDGKTRFTFRKVGRKKVTEVGNFANRLALFVTEDDCMGVINTSGEVVVQPDYMKLAYGGDEAYILGIHKKYRGKDTMKYTVLSLDGKVLCELSSSKYDELRDFEDSKYLAVSKDDKWGIMTVDEEYILRPKDKLKSVIDARGENFIFYDGDKYGVMNIEGETLIRPKYESLKYLSSNILLAENDDEEYFLINIKGEKVGREKFAACYFSRFINGHIIAKTGPNEYVFVNEQGEIVNDAPEMYDYDLIHGDGYAEVYDPAADIDDDEEYDYDDYDYVEAVDSCVADTIGWDWDD